MTKLMKSLRIASVLVAVMGLAAADTIYKIAVMNEATEVEELNFYMGKLPRDDFQPFDFAFHSLLPASKDCNTFNVHESFRVAFSTYNDASATSQTDSYEVNLGYHYSVAAPTLIPVQGDKVHNRQPGSMSPNMLVMHFDERAFVGGRSSIDATLYIKLEVAPGQFIWRPILKSTVDADRTTAMFIYEPSMAVASIRQSHVVAGQTFLFAEDSQRGPTDCRLDAAKWSVVTFGSADDVGHHKLQCKLMAKNPCTAYPSFT